MALKNANWREKPAEWAVSEAPVAYETAVAAMERRVAEIRADEAGERVWLLEHPPLYTAGVSARRDDLLEPDRFPVFKTGRGGEYTYHGPGQRIAYAMLDLGSRTKDVRAYVRDLEGWLIDALAALGVVGERRDDRVGVWVKTPDGERKIAAIGVRVRRWVTFHGISLNVDPDLSHFSGIVPCGISDFGVTSLKALGAPSGMDATDAALRAAFEERFGPTTVSPV